MKYLYLTVLCVSALYLSSCFRGYPIQCQANPIYLQLVQDIEIKLQPLGLKVNRYCSDVRTHLIHNLLLYLETDNHCFVDSEKAENFLKIVIKDIGEVVDQPKYRVYLDTYPVDLNKIVIIINCFDSIIINCFDRRIGKLLEPPYFYRIGFDRGSYLFKYNNS